MNLYKSFLVFIYIFEQIMHQIIGDIELDTNGPSLIDITRHIASWIKINEFEKGILNLYILHTSASLLIQENADPDVLEDLLNFFQKLHLQIIIININLRVKMICLHILKVH